MKITMKALWQREQGQDLVEYALVGALVTLASVAALNNVAGLLTNCVYKCRGQYEFNHDVKDTRFERMARAIRTKNL